MWIHIYLNIFLFFLKMHKCQYPNQQPKNTCQNPRNTALVEQFFNIIFTEFHNTPPVCVCVQMCIDQATYCYPNGCLKRPEKKVESTSNPVNQIEYGTTKSVMFLVDDKQDFDYIFESPKANSNAEKREMPQNNEMTYTQNPFKELFIKYKKLPKLEMRYNLREQVRNSKASKLKREKLDMLKTKWPINTHFLKGKQLFNKIYKRNNGIRQTKFFISMIPDTESVLEAPTFYKKLITKRDDASVNVEALYLYETDAANFSLETLIDNLIVGSLDKNIDKKEMKSVANSNNNLNATKHLTEISNKQTESKTNKIVKNPTNENNDTNAVILETFNQNSSYLEIMTTMAEKIDKQNNLTVVLAKRFTEKLKPEKIDKDNALDVNVSENIKFEKAIVVTENTLATDNLRTDSQSVIPSTTIKRFSIPELKTSMKKSKKKRIVRKLF